MNRAGLYTDLAGLDALRRGAQKNDKNALLNTARQFESLFVRQLLKTMRQANEVFAKDSPFNSDTMKFYRDMQDQQLAVQLSQDGGLGLAKIIAQQLAPDGKTLMPASALTPKDTIHSTVSLAPKSGQEMSLPVKAKPAVNRSRSVTSVEHSNVKPVADSSPEAFVGSILPYARQAAAALGCSPAVLVAQAALETGWGRKVLSKADGDSSLNLFNIKAGNRWQGDSVKAVTLEYNGNQPKKETARFKAYDSLADSFADYVKLLQHSPRYQQALKWAKEPARFLQELQGAGYATDPHYAQKILQVLGHPALSKGAP
ncbi:flagellar assembly peptidoglycan hydrolase FlgJ [Gallaecimonas sp. GXIMD1310]|uniref:flagellar assembly peptidoglycan hydrolase FlgJ n=1 Tax=Gallaecimonas sp. GXIMD1310 TaxID=3131926 RepID=UPI00324B5B0B